MPEILFQCPSCSQSFRVPSEKIPAQGGKGKCRECQTPLVIYPDGRIITAEDIPAEAAPAQAAEPPPAAASPPPAASEDPIWEVKPLSKDSEVAPGPYSISQLGGLICEGEVDDDDLVRVMGGDFQPLRSYVALQPYIRKRVEKERTEHGDPQHCVYHPNIAPEWQCLKCGNYLCENCVINRPIIEGGKPRYLCKDCEAETRTLSKEKGIGKSFKRLFGKK